MAAMCPNCGFPNEPDEIVCAKCGLTLAGIEAPNESTRPEIARLALSGALAVAAPAPPTMELQKRDIVAGLAGAPAPRTPPPELVHAFPETAPSIRIGYSQENDFVVTADQVSSKHAQIARDRNRYVLRDLGSTNGTFVNGYRITSPVVVHVGDTLSLGSHSFRFGHDLIERIPSREQVKLAHSPELPERLRQPFILGREANCDIVLEPHQVSRRHAEITYTGNGWRVRDLGSSNGTAVNNQANKVKDIVVTDDDILFFGSYRFPVNRLYEFINIKSTDGEDGTFKVLRDQQFLTIGRDAQNDVVFDTLAISRFHARVIRIDDAYYLEDLGSSNGTFVDGNRVTERVLLPPSAVFRLGKFEVRLDLERGEVVRSYRGDIQLQAEDLTVIVEDNKTRRRILDSVSFTAYPTEFVGLLGPSGAGKTTLLMALIGYVKPARGRTLVNGDDLAYAYDRYRGAIGYVPQEDIIHGELTVYEALYYTAKLRLPPDTTDAEIDQRVTQVLNDLEIADTRHVRIGTPDRKGISGGQRKRVNLALELLTEPSLLCLDEPTSGLASEDALNVMRLLRKLADGGRTILLTIHQPSLQAYRLMDNVLYLADGQGVYYGPGYPESMLYFHPNATGNTSEAARVQADPGTVMEAIMAAKRAGEPMEKLAERYRQSRFHEEYVVQRRDNRGAAVRVAKPSARKRPRFSVRQWITLCRRYFTIRMKDRIGMFVLLVQAPVIALLLDLVFASESHDVTNRMEFTPYALFLLVVSAIWFGCSNAAREIVSEQAIYRRERMVNLSVAAYVLSKFTVLGIFCFFQCVVLLAGTYMFLDFWGNPLFHLAMLWFASLTGVGMGLLLSAAVRTTEAAMATVPLLLIPQIILGGAIMPVDRMSTPMWAVSHLVMSRWAFEGVLQAEHLNDAYEVSASDASQLAASPMDTAANPLTRFFGESETWLAVDLGVLVVFFIAFIFAVSAVMRVRD